MAKFQGIKIRENAMVYILEILSLADFRHLGLLCGGGMVATAWWLRHGGGSMVAAARWRRHANAMATV